MEHPLDLVRQERLLEKVERPAARLEIRHEAGAFALPPARRLPGVEPVLQPAGDPEAVGARPRHLAQCIERFPGAPAQAAVVPPGLLYECGLRALDLLRSRHSHRATVPLVEKDLDAVARSVASRVPTARRGRAVAAHAVQGALDMLAGPQPIGAMVLALARVDVRAQRTDLHRVAAAVRRRDPVIAEGARTLVERVHLDDLGPAAPLPPPDLVRIRRDPSAERRRPVILQAPASGGGFPSRFVHGAFRFAACTACRVRGIDHMDGIPDRQSVDRDRTPFP